MSYIIQEDSFSRKLESTNDNFVFTEILLNKGVKDYNLPGLAIFPGYRFVKSTTEDLYCLIFNDGANWITLYAVKLEYQTEITYPEKAATQIMVWRASSILHKNVLDGFPHLFFIHLLSTSNIVIADSEQTIHGKRFWKRMLEWASYSRYYIYVTDGTKGENWPKCLVDNFEELCDIWEKYVWGNDRDTHSYRLFIISKNELPSINNFEEETE